MRYNPLVFITLMSCLSISACHQSWVECDDLSEADESVDSLLRPGAPCVEKSDDEKALIHLNRGNALAAIALLEPLVGQYPVEYFRYPRLAAAYALAGEFKFFRALEADFSSGSVLDNIQAFTPNPREVGLTQYSRDIDYIDSARHLLGRLIDVAPTIVQDPEVAFGAAVGFQLRIYSAALAVMRLARVQLRFEESLQQSGLPDLENGGEFNQDALETMTDADVEDILASLAVAADVPATDERDAAMKVRLQSALSEVDSQEGASQKEKLIRFIETDQQGGG